MALDQELRAELDSAWAAAQERENGKEIIASRELIANRRLRFRFMKHDAWENALFVHWPIDPAILKAQLPRGLEPDVLEGSAWIGLVLLTERGVSATPAAGRIFLPKIDHLGANIRTYVTHKGVPGIYFFSLECSSYFASLGARAGGIPYFPARMQRTVDIDSPLLAPPISDQSSARCFPWQGSSAPPPEADGKAEGPEDFVFQFRSERVYGGQVVSARWRLQDTEMEESDLERGRWFTERYSVYAAWPLGRGPLLLRGDVEHPRWKLQPATLDELSAEPLLTSAGFPELASVATFSKNNDSSLPVPHVCFSRGVGPVDFWMLEPP